MSHSRLLCYVAAGCAFVPLAAAAMSSPDSDEVSSDCPLEAWLYTDENGPPLRSLSQLRSADGRYPASLRAVLWSASARKGFRVDVRLNEDLVSPAFRHDYFREDGSRATHEGGKEQPCYYKGSLAGDPGSHVALNLCRGQLNGVISVGESRFELDSDMDGYVYATPTFADAQIYAPCHHLPRIDYPRSISGSRSKRHHRWKRAPKHPSYYADFLDGKRRYVELTIVNDYSMYEKFNKDLDLLTERTKQVANVVNAIYFPLNIRVVLVGVETWTKKDQITMREDGDATLDAFLHYRKTRLMTEMPSDNSQLLTNRNFETGVVGKALKGTMCSYEMSGGVNVDHHRRVVAVAGTVAHEMGHNFGMEHDNDTCDCPSRRCIMSPSSGGTWPPNWSSCSLEYLAHGLSHGADYCLHNRPPKAYGGPYCGNGRLEDGEECDCGTPDNCASACCNATTCRLTQGSECGNGACCDLDACRIKPRTAVCRPASGECDLSEHCDGADLRCPTDVHKQDGLACAGGYCGRGACGNRDRQCTRLWGDTGRSSAALCYDYNTKGDFQGNCGHHRFNSSFPKCARQDVLCGRLHCRHENERTEFGFGVVAQTSHTVLRLGTEEFAVCSVAMVDLGGPEDPDPGLVPDGSPCGDHGEMMCHKQKCLPPAEVLGLRACSPPDCHGRGVCNARGNCHCDFGYGGAGCELDGEGGSLDSGPAGPDYAAFTVGMGFALFSLVIILILAVLFMYWKKRKFMANNRFLKYLLPRDEQMRWAKASQPQPPRRKPSIKQRPAPPPPQPPAPVIIKPPAYPAHIGAVDTVKLSFAKPPPPLNTVPLPPAPLRAAAEPRQPPTTATATLPRHKPAPTYNLYGSREPDAKATTGTLPRPAKPAPPRPQRPQPEVMAGLYHERRDQTPSPQEQDGLLGEVLSELRKTSNSPDHYRMDAPADPQPSVSPPSPPPKPKPSPPPDDPQMTTSLKSRKDFFESKTTALPPVMSSSATLPRNPAKGAKAKGPLPPPPPPPPAKVAVTRSASSASSTDSAKGRPKAAPPPPPPASAKPKKAAPPSVAPTAEAEEEEENYYDVILTPSDERRPKPPLPSKPPALTPKVSSLAAKFDEKSGSVQARIV